MRLNASGKEGVITGLLYSVYWSCSSIVLPSDQLYNYELSYCEYLQHRIDYYLLPTYRRTNKSGFVTHKTFIIIINNTVRAPSNTNFALLHEVCI